MDVSISELRKEGRPLWMSSLGEESFASFIGGGGDIYSDRLAPDWDRFEGVEELRDDDAELTEELLAGRWAGEDYVS